MQNFRLFFFSFFWKNISLFWIKNSFFGLKELVSKCLIEICKCCLPTKKFEALLLKLNKQSGLHMSHLNIQGHPPKTG